MNKIIKEIMMITVLAMVLVSSFNIVYADDTVSCSSIESSASDFIKEGENQYSSNGIDSTKITNQVVPVVQILSVAGILIIGICMVILGIQWVMARPAPEAQAKLKHRFVALAVAAGVMFGSYTIWSIIVKIMDSIDG